MSQQIYRWRATTKYDSDTDLSYGVTPSAQTDWQTVTVGDDPGEKTYTYWYRDANQPLGGQWTDAQSTKVEVPVTQTWTTSMDDNNVLTVTITTTVGNIDRTDKRGNDTNDPGRDIDLYKRSGGDWELVAAWTDNQVATEHRIATGPFNLGTVTFTITPSSSPIDISSLRIRNETVGYASYDDISIGVQFLNPMPPNYIPGKIWNGSDWLSHNRATNGHAKQYNGSAWGNDMKTINGGTASGDPPEIWHSSSSKKNMRKIGSNA